MEGANRYPLLLSPFEIRGRRLRNRIVSTPHATGWSRDGLIDRSEVDYHVRKAAGGCGLVMSQMTHIGHQLSWTARPTAHPP